jgi:hypothetical protein
MAQHLIAILDLERGSYDPLHTTCPILVVRSSRYLSPAEALPLLG